MLRTQPFDGPGLAHYQAPEGWQSVKDNRVLDWPALVCASDQGPDAWSAQSWCESEGRMNWLRDPDTNHGVHGDTIGAAGEAGLLGFLYGLTVVLNIHFIPFNNGSNGQKIVQCTDSFRRFGSAKMALFKAFYREIAREQGYTEAEIDSDANMEAVFQRFLDASACNRAGSKVGMCRWYQVFQRLLLFIPCWTSFLVVLLRVNFNEPWMRDGLFTTRFSTEVQIDSTTPGVAPAQTKESATEALRALRAAARNSMQFVILFLVNPVHKRVALLLAVLTTATHCWYQEQAKKIKDADKCFAWKLRQSCGEYFEPLRNTFKLLRTPHRLEQMGFSIRFGPSDLNQQAGAAAFSDDDYVAARAGRFVQALIFKRIKRGMWLFLGWPGAFVQLLGDADTRDKLIACIRKTVEAYEWLEAQNTAASLKLVSRSPMRLVAVHQIVIALKCNEWQLTGRCRELLKQRSSSFGQSRIVEDGFLKERREEARAQLHEMAETHIWT